MSGRAGLPAMERRPSLRQPAPRQLYGCSRSGTTPALEEASDLRHVGLSGSAEPVDRVGADLGVDLLTQIGWAGVWTAVHRGGMRAAAESHQRSPAIAGVGVAHPPGSAVEIDLVVENSV